MPHEFIYGFIMVGFRVCELACCIAIAIRFRRSIAGLLGGLAFGTWFLMGVMREILFAMEVWWAFEYRYVFPIINLLAYGLLFAAILTAPIGKRVIQYSGHVVPVGPVSKGFYIGMILGSLTASTVISLISLAFTNLLDEPMIGLSLMAVSFPLMIFGIVMVCIMIHKMWKALDPEWARTSPGKAVGFLFIPIFNIYWVFQVYWGWTKDFNKYVAQNDIKSPRMPEGVALALCILTLLGMIPLVGYVVVIANYILYGILLSNICDGINVLAAAKEEAQSDPADGVAVV